jgi:hypothetical protein
MDSVLLVLAGLMLYLFFMWRTVSVCRRFRLWVLPVVLLFDHALLFLLPYAFIPWKLWFFWAMFRWEPVRGLFRLPRWPRTHFARGPGRRGPRQFSEPMPWQAGPVSGE